MKILAIDTTAVTAAAALVEDGRILGTYQQNGTLTHSETMLNMVENLLSNAKVTPDMLDLLAVSAGPGSFTGVRIGVSIIKGLAFGQNIPCVPVSTLDALSENLRPMAEALGHDFYVCPVMDARRAQVYNALFHVEGGTAQRLREDRAISLAELKEDIKNLSEPVFLVGDGSVLCYNALKDAVQELELPPEHRMHQRAAGVALAARQMIARGEKGDGGALTPNYLRLSQAERERLAREQK